MPSLPAPSLSRQCFLFDTSWMRLLCPSRVNITHARRASARGDVGRPIKQLPSLRAPLDDALFPPNSVIRAPENERRRRTTPAHLYEADRRVAADAGEQAKGRIPSGG